MFRGGPSCFFSCSLLFFNNHEFLYIEHFDLYHTNSWNRHLVTKLRSPMKSGWMVWHFQVYNDVAAVPESRVVMHLFLWGSTQTDLHMNTHTVYAKKDWDILTFLYQPPKCIPYCFKVSRHPISNALWELVVNVGKI